jgi:hypothetical protein
MVRDDHEFAKFSSGDHSIIVLDGVWGSGKSLLSPILNSMKSVQMVRYEMLIEELAILSSLGKIHHNTAKTLLEMHSDDLFYCNVIGRNMNFRWNDDSGFKNNPRKGQSVRRIFGPEGDEVLRGACISGEYLHLMTHNLLPVSDVLFRTFGSRLKFIEIVRHPVFMFEHWRSYFSRFNNTRESTLSFNINSKKVPWFALDWANEFSNSTFSEQSVLGILHLQREIFSRMQNHESSKNSILILSFEALCFDSLQSLEKLYSYLNVDFTTMPTRAMRASKIPRARILSGKGHEKYGWQKNLGVSDDVYMEQIIAQIRDTVSKKIFEMFIQAVEEYNEVFPSKLNVYKFGG